MCITDRDHVIAASGNGKREYDGKNISKDMEALIENRGRVLAERGEKRFIKVTEDDKAEFEEQAISTIICEGDAIGAVVLYGKEEKGKMTETESKLAAVAAGFLGRQMEQ